MEATPATSTFTLSRVDDFNLHPTAAPKDALSTSSKIEALSLSVEDGNSQHQDSPVSDGADRSVNDGDTSDDASPAKCSSEHVLSSESDTSPSTSKTGEKREIAPRQLLSSDSSGEDEFEVIDVPGPSDAA